MTCIFLFPIKKPLKWYKPNSLSSNKIRLVTKYFLLRKIPRRAVIKVERRQLVGSVATNFLFAYSAWIRWLAGLCNWICPAPRERDHVSSEPTGAGCHSTNRQTSLSQLKHLRIILEADCHGILPWRARFEAIKRSKRTVVTVSRVENRDAENLLSKPSEVSK